MPTRLQPSWWYRPVDVCQSVPMPLDDWKLMGKHRHARSTWESATVWHGSLARYVKLWVAHAPGMPGTFSPPLQVSDPDMHHGTCVSHVPWCLPGSLTSGFLWNRWRGKSSRHSRRMRIQQFYVSSKRPIMVLEEYPHYAHTRSHIRTHTHLNMLYVACIWSFLGYAMENTVTLILVRCAASGGMAAVTSLSGELFPPAMRQTAVSLTSAVASLFAIFSPIVGGPMVISQTKMLTPWHGNGFHTNSPLWRESTGDHTLKAINAELWCFRWC